MNKEQKCKLNWAFDYASGVQYPDDMILVMYFLVYLMLDFFKSC